MKVKFSYLQSEEETVLADVAALKKLHPGAKIKQSERHPPYNHVYFAVAEPKKVETASK